jgi:hypothetical protein
MFFAEPNGGDLYQSLASEQECPPHTVSSRARFNDLEILTRVEYDADR